MRYGTARFNGFAQPTITESSRTDIFREARSIRRARSRSRCRTRTRITTRVTISFVRDEDFLRLVERATDRSLPSAHDCGDSPNR